ncbi:MAG: ABC transporter permease [Chloroflexi bacterium]|nr:ABC transporter permease [Chloroflexota bacterium]MBI3732640.1 ABC transporter permease [Chloroflexota bacterium]
MKSPGLLALAWRRFWRDKLAVVGTAVLLLLGLMALLATPLASEVTHFQPEQIELLGNLKPLGWARTPERPAHWLGTDELGRDVLTRIMFGAQVSLFIAVLTVALTLTIGTLSGAMAGYFGGVVDMIISALINVLLSVPLLFLLILISAVFRPPWWGLAIVLASVSWTGVARLVRGEFLTIKVRDYIEAARVIGSSNPRIIFRHILPNATSPMIVAATLQIGGVILTETALSFLGFGVQPPTPSWGNMLTNAQQYLFLAPVNIFVPGLFIFVTVLSVNFMGNGLRDALDPRLKQ